LDGYGIQNILKGAIFMDKSSQNDKTRARNYNFQRNYHYDTHDAQGNLTSSETEEQWRARMDKLYSDLDALKAEDCAFIFHDKDPKLDEDGNPTQEKRGLHLHGVIRFKESIPKSLAVKRLGVSSEFNCEVTQCPSQSYGYLLHQSEQALQDVSSGKKHMYDPSELHLAGMTREDFTQRFTYRSLDRKGRKGKQSAYSEKELKKLQKEYRNKCSMDIAEGRKTILDVERDYKRDAPGFGLTMDIFTDSEKYFLRALKSYMQEVKAWFNEHPRSLTSIIISGPGGYGKTTAAKAIGGLYADHRGIHRMPTPAKGITYDPSGDYKGEIVSIFNEMSSQCLDLRQILSMLDPLEATDMSSRYFNKCFFPNYMIFTCTKDVEYLIADIWKDWARKQADNEYGKFDSQGKRICWTDEQLLEWYGDEIRQLRRRFAIRIQIKSKVRTDLLFEALGYPPVPPTFRACVRYNDKWWKNMSIKQRRAVILFDKRRRSRIVVNGYAVVDGMPKIERNNDEYDKELKVFDKLCRRAVELRPNVFRTIGADIYYRLDSVNPPTAYFDEKVEKKRAGVPGYEKVADPENAWRLYRTVYDYNEKDADKVNELAQVVDAAIKMYYKVNKFSIVPWDESWKPPFLRKKKNAAKSSGNAAGVGKDEKEGEEPGNCQDKGEE